MPKMPVKLHASGAALPVVAQGVAPPTALLSDVLGESGSGTALAKLESAISDLRAIQVAPFLQRALDALRRDDAPVAGNWAIKALEKDEKNGLAWQLLGISREKLGDLATALKCFESALQLLPEGRELSNDLGRLAYKLGMLDVAAKLFQHFLELHPELPDGGNNLACVLRDQRKFDEAVALLQATLALHPENPMMWNTLGSVLRERGETETSIIFFEEAMRLDPHFAKARYNRGNARAVLGDASGGLGDVEGALAHALSPDDTAMMAMARSTMLLCNGRLDEGWDAYEVRFDPAYSGVTYFASDRPRWVPGDDLAGKTLLLFAEQGLGDEVLFGSLIPELLADLGPDGHLHIAVEPRLVELFQRSFPQASVTAHATYDVDAKSWRVAPGIPDQGQIDLWTPMGSLLRQYRRNIGAFPNRPGGFLTPDPARVAHWREVLKAAPAGPKVGILWKSMKLEGTRWQSFSPFRQWAPVLQTPGVTFVNLQYGDCTEELALAKAELGVDIWTPPGIDLKMDLDDLAALACALDLTLGFANATSNIAAAAGAPVWLIAIPGAWVQCGTDRYPWYPQARTFNPARLGEWDAVMAEVGDALKVAF
jgi:tetratricopeptide (TPR) repeat protein